MYMYGHGHIVMCKCINSERQKKLYTKDKIPTITKPSNFTI